MGIFGFGSIIENYITEAPEENEVKKDELETNDLDSSEDSMKSDETSEDNIDSEEPDKELDDDTQQSEDDELLNDDDSEVDNLNDTNNSDENENPESDSSDNDLTEIQRLENELYDNLTDAQKGIRDKEQLRLFCGLYTKINDTVDKLDRVITNSENMEKIDYCSVKLSEVKNVIYDYILDTYNTKSYIQNVTSYYEFIAIINAIIKIIDKIDINS